MFSSNHRKRRQKVDGCIQMNRDFVGRIWQYFKDQNACSDLHFLDQNLRKNSAIIGIEPLTQFDSETITDSTIKILREG